MRFKDFITRQRVGIFVVGIAAFVISLTIAHFAGFATITGALFIDLAASAVTIIFTTLIIDYLGLKEEHNKTKNAAGLAEDELKATCFRVRLRMARLFGLDRHDVGRDNISNRQEARDYIETVEREVTQYLESHSIVHDTTPLQADILSKYLTRLETARAELEQILLLYEYAMGYSLRERVLNLRSELQIADNILGYIDADDLNDANISLIRILSQSIYERIEDVLGHDSRTEVGVPINEKDSRLV